MSHSDSDLAVSVYDPEDNLNFYGSPVERDDLSDCKVEGSASTAQPRNVAAAATTSNENIDTEQVSVYLYFVPILSYAFLLISTSAIFILQLRIHAVDIAEGKNLVPPAVTKICIVVTSVRVGQKNFVVKIKNKVPSVRLMLTLERMLLNDIK